MYTMSPLRSDRPGRFNVTESSSWLLESVKHNRQGYARSEDVIDVLGDVGLDNGTELFQSLGLNPHGQVHLTNLLTHLNDASTKTNTQEPVLAAAFICSQQQVKHLRSLLDESAEENKRLKLDLAEVNARNALLVLEEDERHAQLDKSWEARLLLVDKKYQEQVKELNTEMDNIRTSSGAEISRLSAQLEQAKTLSVQEEQQLTDKLARCQEEMLRQEKALTESSKQLMLLGKQNESLAKKLQHKISKTPEDYKIKLAQLEQALAMRREENLKLKDFNDELVYELERVQQKLLLEERKVQEATTRLPIPSAKTSQMEDNNFINDDSALVEILENQHNKELGDYHNKSPPNISKELIQHEMVEQRLREIEGKYKKAVDILEEKHNSELRRMNDDFDQEKKSMVNQLNKKDETIPVKQFNELQTSVAQEKFDLIQKCASEKNLMQHLHEQEIKVLQKRLQETESYIEANTRMQNLIDNLKTQLTLCQSDIQNLENQKSDFDIRLWQKEMNLRRDFEEERNNLMQQFSLEREQQQIRHNHALAELFHGGADNLPGKLRVDFHQIVLENTEKEVRRSQSTILNQLNRDRGKLVTTLEQEKLHMYEKAENERKALEEKFEIQIAELQTELDDAYSQLEAEKQTLSEITLRSVEESAASHNAVENLRRKMEGELVIELTRFKESFELEKNELASENVKLQENLSELQILLSIERKKAADLHILKENVKILRAEKARMEQIVEEIKEKVDQQISVERADNEIHVKAAKDEGESLGRMEGLNQGREEGLLQGRKEGYENGFNKGRVEGQAAGFIQGKKNVDAATVKSLKEMKELVDSLKQEQTILDTELRQEREKNITFVQQLQDMDQLKALYDFLLEEKNALENKYTKSLALFVDKQKAEKINLMKEIHKLEAQSINLQSDMQTIEFQIGSVHQDLQTVKETFDQEVTLTETESDGANLSEEPESLKEQIEQLSYQLKDNLTAKHDLEHLKKGYDALLLEKSELEKTVRALTCDIPNEDSSRSRLQSAKVIDLNEGKQGMFVLLNQTSDQLDKVSTSMAFVQSKCVREIESMKQRAKYVVEVENYTKLQKWLLEHQGLVITLQDTLRRREALIEKVIKDTEVQICPNTQTNVKDTQNKLDFARKELAKYKEKYKQMCDQSRQQNLKMKEMYGENSGLIMALTETEERKNCLEQQCRKLNVMCETYRKEMDLVYENLSR